MHKIFANTIFLGKQLVSLPSCHSTNDLMAQMAASNKLSEGAIVITDHQTKGKGQRGNQWLTAPGENLTVSIFLTPSFLTIEQHFHLNRIVSLAIYDTLSNFCSACDVSIKWPNDIYVGTKKIAGVLIENTISQKSIRESIIGIGLNVNQVENLPENACSLKSVMPEKKEDFILVKVLEFLIQSLERYYRLLKNAQYHQLANRYEDHLYLKDCVSVFEDENGKFNGIIKGVGQNGMLEIQDESDRIRSYYFKEVKFMR